MRAREPRLSLGHRVLRLSLTWLFIGALVGVVGVERKGGAIGIACMMVSGMIVLTIPGILLGVIGGDARGSVVGVSCGLFGCGLAKLSAAVSMQPQVIGAVVIFCGLFGATVYLFVRIMFWRYRLMFRCICWLTEKTQVSGTFSALAGHLQIPQRSTGNSVLRKNPSIAKPFS